MGSSSFSSPINALPTSLLLRLPSVDDLTHTPGFRNLKYGDDVLNCSSSPDLWHNLLSHLLRGSTSNSSDPKRNPSFLGPPHHPILLLGPTLSVCGTPTHLIAPGSHPYPFTTPHTPEPSSLWVLLLLLSISGICSPLPPTRPRPPTVVPPQVPTLPALGDCSVQLTGFPAPLWPSYSPHPMVARVMFLKYKPNHVISLL